MSGPGQLMETEVRPLAEKNGLYINTSVVCGFIRRCFQQLVFYSVE